MLCCYLFLELLIIIILLIKTLLRHEGRAFSLGDRSVYICVIFPKQVFFQSIMWVVQWVSSHYETSHGDETLAFTVREPGTVSQPGLFHISLFKYLCLPRSHSPPEKPQQWLMWSFLEQPRSSCFKFKLLDFVWD